MQQTTSTSTVAEDGPRTIDIDSIAFFDALSVRMNEQPTLYETLGDVDLDLVVVMRGDVAAASDDGAFRVRLRFAGITCDGVAPADAGDERAADCWLTGPLDAWAEMFADIVEHGHATGRHTINSLTLMGDRIAVQGADPLGVDKFFRFNQTMQSFFDGAADVARADGGSREEAP